MFDLFEIEDVVNHPLMTVTPEGNTHPADPTAQLMLAELLERYKKLRVVAEKASGLVRIACYDGTEHKVEHKVVHTWWNALVEALTELSG